MSHFQSGNGTTGSDLWMRLVACCMKKRDNPPKRKSKRVIDRSMIGEPTNFQHTGHIGTSDVDMEGGRLRAIQHQMQSKGGYETAVSPVKAY